MVEVRGGWSPERRCADQELPAYAAGSLSGSKERAVRAHLATGCPECLARLYEHPVGRPREVGEGDTTTAGGQWSVGGALAVVATGIAVVGASLLSAAPPDPSDSAQRRGAVPAVAVDAGDRAGPPHQVARLEGEAARLERTIGELASRAQFAWSEQAAVRADLEDARRRADGAAKADGVLRDIAAALAGRGTHFAPLRADDERVRAHGRAVWDPLRRRLMVYAVGLPALGRDWRLHVTGAEGRGEYGLGRRRDGAVAAEVRVPEDFGCRLSLAVQPPSAPRPKLSGTLEVCG